MKTVSIFTKIRCLLGAVVFTTALTMPLTLADTLKNTSSTLTHKEEAKAHHGTLKKTVISLSPAATELIYELNLEHHLIAVDQNSNFPEAVKKLPNIGDPFNPNIELLAQYQPSFLIHYTYNPVLETIQKTLGVELLMMQAQNMTDLFDQAELLNEKLEHSSTEKIQAWRQQWQELQNTFAHTDKKVFIFLGANPMYTLGKEAFLSQSLRTCGVRGLFDEKDTLSLMVSPESLLINPPDKVLAGLSPHDNKKERTQFILNSLQKIGLNLNENQIVLFNQDILFRPTVRFLNHLPALCQALQAP